MTGMLASVRNWQEVQIVLNEKVDIIDLKEPELGALGALPVDLVTEIVKNINQKCLVSATVGDLPMNADIIFNAVSEMAKTNVDFVKMGFFSAENWFQITQKLANLTEKYRLIAVLFADSELNFSMIPELKNAGFSGVMLDTMQKKNGSLTQILTIEKISEFVSLAKDNNLICGLAGSLRLENIAELLVLESDYLGFRGALCCEHNRALGIDINAIKQIRRVI